MVDTLEIQKPLRPLSEIYAEILELSPQPTDLFVADNAEEQKLLFLNDKINNPGHLYGNLTETDFETIQSRLELLGDEIIAHPETSEKYKKIYREGIERNIKIAQMLKAAAAVKSEQDEERRSVAEEEFMKLNIELYGTPDHEAYLSLVQELKDEVLSKQLTGEAAKIRQELLDMLPGSEFARQRFIPSQETVEWTGDVVNGLYGGMLEHVPDPADKDSFGPYDIRDVFEEVIRSEFGEVAADWQVVVEPATSIKVKEHEKKIIIPESRKPVNAEKLRGLVVHEIGVHMLRSVSGYESDMFLLAIGTPGYEDNEEGLGKVMEQAEKGKYEDSGIPYYLAASLAHFEGKDFRGVHEVLWRHKLLLDAKDGQAITEEDIENAKSSAYISTNRIFRGTDSVPWFKDLSYFNGAEKMWRHLENIRGDDFALQMLFLGKTDTTNADHKRVLLETKTP